MTSILKYCRRPCRAFFPPAKTCKTMRVHGNVAIDRFMTIRLRPFFSKVGRNRSMSILLWVNSAGLFDMDIEMVEKFSNSQISDKINQQGKSWWRRSTFFLRLAVSAANDVQIRCSIFFILPVSQLQNTRGGYYHWKLFCLYQHTTSEIPYWGSNEVCSYMHST